MDKIIGLRIDVDTWRGTKCGVPALMETLARHGIKGTFYFSVGPDNMGRHLWRLLKPAFLWKMLRTDAAGLYGPEIIFMGTAWPGPGIGKRLGYVIKDCAAAGHEIGFHAWDHHHAQAKIDSMSPDAIRAELQKGCDLLERVTGAFPVTSATPGWRTNDMLLSVKAEFSFSFNSDCRGSSAFYPVVHGQRLRQLQLPVTLPTYDEILGRDGVTDVNYNERQMALLRPGELNVLTIHAEAEGGKCKDMFDAYLTRVLAEGWRVVPLGELAAQYRNAPDGAIAPEPFPGREGWLACQVPVPEK